MRLLLVSLANVMPISGQPREAGCPLNRRVLRRRDPLSVAIELQVEVDLIETSPRQPFHLVQKLHSTLRSRAAPNHLYLLDEPRHLNPIEYSVAVLIDVSPAVKSLVGTGRKEPIEEATGVPQNFHFTAALILELADDRHLDLVS
jgi:hypothetical protein